MARNDARHAHIDHQRVELTVTRTTNTNNFEDRYLLEGPISTQESEAILNAQPNAAQIYTSQLSQFDLTIETAFEKQPDGTFKSTSPLPTWMGTDAYLEANPASFGSIGIKIVNDDLPLPRKAWTFRINGVWTSTVNLYSRGTNYYAFNLLPSDLETIINYDGTPIADEPVPPRSEEAVWDIYESMGFTRRQGRQWQRLIRDIRQAYSSIPEGYIQREVQQSRLDRCLSDLELMNQGFDPLYFRSGIYREEVEIYCNQRQGPLQRMDDDITRRADFLRQLIARRDIWESGRVPGDSYPAPQRAAVARPAEVCNNTEPYPEGYSLPPRRSGLFNLSGASFYRTDFSGLAEDTRLFEFCLKPGLKATMRMNRSYTTENGSLVWEGQIFNTQFSLGHQLANLVTLVKRNGKVMGTVWIRGHLYRIWPSNDDLYKIEQIRGRSLSGSNDPYSRVSDPPIPAVDTDERIPEISVMVVFTSNSSRKVGDIHAFSDLAIAEANFALRASRIKARFKLAQAVDHDYNESGATATKALERMVDPEDGYMDDIHTLRDQYEADIGVLIVANATDGNAARILARPEQAFSYVSSDTATGFYAFAHEIGHLLGGQHDDGGKNPYPFSLGYVDPGGSWFTIMAYPCGGCLRINLWANPNITVLGEPAGTAEFNDNARLINMNASAFASFYGETHADISGAGTLLQNGATVTDLEGQYGQSTLYAIDVPEGATDLRVEVDDPREGIGLYIKAAAMAVPGSADCTQQYYIENKVCEFPQPEATRYHILIYADRSRFSDATLRVSYQE